MFRLHTLWKLRQLTFPLALIAFTTAYLAEAIAFGSPIRYGVPSASFMPILLSVVMYMALSMIVFNQIRAMRSSQETAEEPAPAGARPFLVVAATAIYIALFIYAGFEISTGLYVYTLLSLFGYSDSKTLSGQSKRLVASAVITTVIYVFFVFGFSVQLPTFEGLQ